MRMALLFLAALPLASCQTIGSSTGESVTVECSSSPLQIDEKSGWTPSDVPCRRTTTNNPTLNADTYYRFFAWNNAFANLELGVAYVHTFFRELDAQAVAMIFKPVKEGSRDWKFKTTEDHGSGRLHTHEFELSGDKKCWAFARYKDMAPMGQGYRQRLYGYYCTLKGERNRSAFEKFLSSVTVNEQVRVVVTGKAPSTARIDTAPASPVSQPETNKILPPAASQPVPAMQPPSTAAPSSRLATLKDLYDRKLITPEEYEAKRKEILGTL